MKKFFNSITTKISAMATRAKTAVAAAAASTTGAPLSGNAWKPLSDSTKSKF